MTELTLYERDDGYHTDPECGVDITVISKLKHADLWALVRRFGSQAKLAAYLGVQQAALSKWINLKSCPPSEPFGTVWTADFLADFETKLLDLTGKTLEDLFPESLRQGEDFLSCSKTIEKTVRLRESALASYASLTNDRLRLLEPSCGVGEPERQRRRIEAAMQTLTHREREILKARFGIDQQEGRPLTLDELSKTYKVKRSQIRKIEQRALRRMQGPTARQLLLSDTESE